MSNHTRRQFLGLVASLLTLLDAVRRFFKPPEVVEVSRSVFGNIFQTEFYRRLPTTNPLREFLVDRRDGAHRLILDVEKDGKTIRYAGPWVAERRVTPKDDAERIYGLNRRTLD